MTTFQKKSSIGGLTITRREGDKIVVNHGELIIEVVGIRGNRVKLSFKAHKEIDIRRSEQVESLPPPLPGAPV